MILISPYPTNRDKIGSKCRIKDIANFGKIRLIQFDSKHIPSQNHLLVIMFNSKNMLLERCIVLISSQFKLSSIKIKHFFAQNLQLLLYWLKTLLTDSALLREYSLFKRHFTYCTAHLLAIIHFHLSLASSSQMKI